MKNKYMMCAIEEARKGINLGHGGPFGCVIVKDGKIVGKGHNEVLKNNDPTCHGEIMAIHKASKKLQNFDLKGCTLYTTGEPCPMCMAAIKWANIDKVYFGCNVNDTEIIGFRDKRFYEEQNGKGGSVELVEIDRDECLKLYQEYIDIEDKVNY